MSYDLAVWSGPMPKSSGAATQEYLALYTKHFESRTSAPSPQIRKFVAALTATYPDLDEENEDESPWSDAPLIGNASGPMFYFGMVFSRAVEVVPIVAALAAQHGLVLRPAGRAAAPCAAEEAQEGRRRGVRARRQEAARQRDRADA